MTQARKSQSIAGKPPRVECPQSGHLTGTSTSDPSQRCLPRLRGEALVIVLSGVW